MQRTSLIEATPLLNQIKGDLLLNLSFPAPIGIPKNPFILRSFDKLRTGAQFRIGSINWLKLSGDGGVIYERRFCASGRTGYGDQLPAFHSRVRSLYLPPSRISGQNAGMQSEPVPLIS